MAGASDITHWFPLAAGFCVLGLSSCDQAEKLAKQAKSKVSEKVEEVTERVEDATKKLPESKEATTERKSELDAMVDQTPEGYQFRRDLPFSPDIEVIVEAAIYMKGRFYKSNLLGNETTSIKGTLRDIITITRHGDKVNIDRSRSPFEPDDAALKAKVKEDGVKYEKTSAEFVRKNDKWNVRNPGDLMEAAAAAEWKAGFNGLLAREGLAARKQWFGKGRLKIGDSITLSGGSLELFEVRPAEGKLVLTLEAVESLEGHPCGVFSVRGTYECNGDGPSLAGSSQERISIESGKLWLSLLYPLILKEDYEAVMSASGGTKGDQMMRTQGTVHVQITRKWRPLKEG